MVTVLIVGRKGLGLLYVQQVGLLYTYSGWEGIVIYCTYSRREGSGIYCT